MDEIGFTCDIKELNNKISKVRFIQKVLMCKKAIVERYKLLKYLECYSLDEGIKPILVISYSERYSILGVDLRLANRKDI